MLEEITRQNLGSIRNSTFRHYARIYVDIYESFLAQVGQFGLPFETDAAPQTQIAQERAALRTLPEIFPSAATAIVSSASTRIRKILRRILPPKTTGAGNWRAITMRGRC